MQLAPLSTLPRGCWEIGTLRVQNLCFSLAVASRPAGTEARFLFAALLPGERAVGAAKVLLRRQKLGCGMAKDGPLWLPRQRVRGKTLLTERADVWDAGRSRARSFQLLQDGWTLSGSPHLSC